MWLPKYLGSHKGVPLRTKKRNRMLIREANIKDAQSLSTLALSLGKFYGDEHPSGISPYFAQKISVEAFENILIDKAYEHHVYEEDQKVIGYFSLLNSTHFFYLFVDETHHKQGIATALIEHVLKDRVHKLYSVNASLYAVPFYKKMGFVPMAFLQKQQGMLYQPMIWDASKNRTEG